MPNDSSTPAAIDAALAELRSRLEQVWDAATSARPHEWHAHLPSLGHSDVTALVVADLFGGDILQVPVDGDIHYYNRLADGSEVDLTRDQFSLWEPAEDPAVVGRAQLVESRDTSRRYEWLRERLAALSWPTPTV